MYSTYLGKSVPSSKYNLKSLISAEILILLLRFAIEAVVVDNTWSSC